MISLNEEMSRLLEEVSSVSGIQRNVIKEVWDFLLIHWAEKIAKNEGALTELTIPYIGKVAVKYVKDSLNEDGTISTEVQQFINLSDEFKKLVGDIHDEKWNVIDEMLEKKLDFTLFSLSSKKIH